LMGRMNGGGNGVSQDIGHVVRLKIIYFTI
jgi:hypothetical protein